MIAKLIEIRDTHTLIAAVAIKCDPANAAEAWLLRRSGYRDNVYVLLGKIDGSCVGDFTYDPYAHTKGARTMMEAHKWLVKHFDEIEPGAVLDVQYVLGETAVPKISERGPDIEHTGAARAVKVKAGTIESLVNEFAEKLADDDRLSRSAPWVAAKIRGIIAAAIAERNAKGDETDAKV